MAYATTNPPALVSQRVGASTGTVWLLSTTDDLGDALASGYITDGDDLGMDVGDIVFIVDTTNSQVNRTVVTTVTSGGAATLSVNQVQELAASGAVTPGVQVLELNHATVVVAATVADAKAHAGLLVIRNTSASGIIPHTVTLTGGTFNNAGNTIATFDTPGEELIVFFDDVGQGSIVTNTGAVVLS